MSLSAARLPEVGELLVGRWRVEAEIGRGGMGVVLRVSDDAQRRIAAMKVLTPDATEIAEAVPRFLNEARVASQLESENVVRVYDTGTLDNGLPFMVMELLEGADLGSILEQHGPLPVADVCDAVIHAADALAEAHARGMVHRDLKPGNLFKTRTRDGRALVKVLDFGVAKLASFALSGAQTSAGTVLGSPHYMAPEQIKSAKDVDARADVWSIGILMYELLEGKLPFDGGSFGALFLQITLEDAPKMTRADVPPSLIEIIGRCMAKDPKDRYSDLAALTQSIARFASPDGVARARKLEGRTRPPAQPLSSQRMALASTMMMPGAPSSPRVSAAPMPPPPPPSSPNIGFAMPSSGALPQVRDSNPRLGIPHAQQQQQPQQQQQARAPQTTSATPTVPPKQLPLGIVIGVSAASALILAIGIVLVFLSLRGR